MKKNKQGKKADTSDKNKASLIKNYIKAFGVVTQACKWANLSRDTFYEYLKKDKNFRKEIEKSEDVIRDNVEGLYIQNDLLSYKKFEARRYWLDRRHPKYKPKGKLEIDPGLHLDINEDREKFK